MVTNTSSTQRTKKRSTKSHRERIAMVSTHGYVAAEAPLGMPDTGGQVVYVLELSKKLAQLGYKVDIWTRRFDDQPEIEEVDTDVRIIRMPCGGRDFIPKEYLYKKLPEWTEHALRFIKTKKLSYAFINSHYWDAGLAGQHMAEVLNVPHIHTPHSIGTWKKREMTKDFPDDEAKLEKAYNFSRRIHHETILYRECDLVIATSPIQLDMFRNDYQLPVDKVRMIPPGYDDNRFYPVGEASQAALRHRFDLPEDQQVVASIGRLSRNKGFDLLVDAFAVVAKRQENVILRLAVGSESEETTEDPMRDELEARIRRHGLTGRVILSGSLDDADMADFYRAADVFCLPSRYEPFGMTAIEAMACGTPTVVTTHGGLYRTLTYGTDALFADTFDEMDFGITILKILRYPKISRRLAVEGAHKVRSLFTWTGIAQQLLKHAEGRRSPVIEVSD
ncbi:MAG: glycosyltransferase [Opitutales bacterium]|nr:glycosyltransferase [Opitutales bacterium]